LRKQTTENPVSVCMRYLACRTVRCAAVTFLSSTIQPTLEVTITETVVDLHRKKRADLGIALISV